MSFVTVSLGKAQVRGFTSAIPLYGLQQEPVQHEAAAEVMKKSDEEGCINEGVPDIQEGVPGSNLLFCIMLLAAASALHSQQPPAPQKRQRRRSRSRNRQHHQAEKEARRRPLRLRPLRRKIQKSRNHVWRQPWRFLSLRPALRASASQILRGLRAIPVGFRGPQQRLCFADH